MSEPVHEGFVDVDDTENPDAFIAYLDEADALPLIQELRREASARLALRPGESVVDVGCGTGTVLAELAATVGESGHAVGVDASAEMLAVARTRVPDRVELVRADAGSLPLEDDSFHAYRAERLYQHLDEPLGALAEARRVLKEDGRIVLVDPDWGGLVVDVDDHETFRLARHASIEARPGATAGRRLRGLLLEAGFRDVDVVGTAPVLTEYAVADRLLLAGLVFTDAARAAVGEDAFAALRTQVEERAAAGRFFASMPVFIASGRY
jgi:SAM-dependent methyltransferase